MGVPLLPLEGCGRDWVGGSEPGHGSTYFIPWSRSSQTQEGIKTNKEFDILTNLRFVPSVSTNTAFASIGLPLASEPSAIAFVVVIVGGSIETVPRGCLVMVDCTPLVLVSLTSTWWIYWEVL